MSRIISRLGSLLFALMLLPEALFLFFSLYVLYFFTERSTGPFLYKCKRLGIWKKPFTMYKIRTLTNEFDKSFSSFSFCEHSKHTLWYGSFLRCTKIDELPQLLNIIKGEMSFIGPRPVRLYDYANSYKHIRNSQIRFSVKPGLTGMSQLYTSAAAPRKLRVDLENKFIRLNKGTLFKINFIGKTIYYVMYKLIQESKKRAVQTINCLRFGKSLKCRRSYERVNVDAKKIKVSGINESQKIDLHPINVNKTHIAISTSRNLNIGLTFNMHVKCETKRKGSIRKHTIKCFTTVEKVISDDQTSIIYICQYKPVNEYNQYLMDKHVLKRVLEKS